MLHANRRYKRLLHTMQKSRIAADLDFPEFAWIIFGLDATELILQLSIYQIDSLVDFKHMPQKSPHYVFLKTPFEPSPA